MQVRNVLWAAALSVAVVAQAVIAAELGSGTASYYGSGFAGKRTANGEAFDPSALTAAHRTAPFGSRIRVTNLGNGKDVVVRVNDRGPWTRGRVIDVSHAAAKKLGMIGSGTAQVSLKLM